MQAAGFSRAMISLQTTEVSIPPLDKLQSRQNRGSATREEPGMTGLDPIEIETDEIHLLGVLSRRTSMNIDPEHKPRQRESIEYMH